MSGIFEFGLSWDFVFRFLSIALIDLALSGDNAVVIGMAAASLPRGRRKLAILFGGGLAIVLRILLTTVATLLLRIPFLAVVGGVVLFWVAWKLLRMNVAQVEDEEQKAARQAKNFRQAIILILTADFMMSLDNVIAVAGTAHGNAALLIAGLLLSMPLLMTTGGVVSVVIDRFRWVVHLGGVVIIFAGARMILEDKWVQSELHVSAATDLGLSALVSVGMVALILWWNKRKEKAMAGAPVLARGDRPRE